MQPRDCSPFPVAPDDVPTPVVRAVMRTALRHPDTGLWDEDMARLFCAVVIAAVAQEGAAVPQAEESTAAEAAVLAR